MAVISSVGLDWARLSPVSNGVVVSYGQVNTDGSEVLIQCTIQLLISLQAIVSIMSIAVYICTSDRQYLHLVTMDTNH